MIVAFVDTSAFIASAYSDTGASREIFRYAIRKELQVVVNQLVLEEVRRNLSSKRPEAGTFFLVLTDSVVQVYMLHGRMWCVLNSHPQTLAESFKRLSHYGI